MYFSLVNYNIIHNHIIIRNPGTKTEMVTHTIDWLCYLRGVSSSIVVVTELAKYIYSI